MLKIVDIQAKNPTFARFIISQDLPEQLTGRSDNQIFKKKG